jgi:hypothetical protein
MSTLKTLVTDQDPIAFINTVEDTSKRNDCLVLLSLFTKITGEKARMWGPSIIGFGMYHYKSERSTQEGDWPRAGFSPRKQNLTIYLSSGFSDYKTDFTKLGKYKTSVGCLYIKRLSDINLAVLEEIITESLAKMNVLYPAK